MALRGFSTLGRTCALLISRAVPHFQAQNTGGGFALRASGDLGQSLRCGSTMCARMRVHSANGSAEVRRAGGSLQVRRRLLRT